MLRFIHDKDIETSCGLSSRGPQWRHLLSVHVTRVAEHQCSVTMPTLSQELVPACLVQITRPYQEKLTCKHVDHVERSLLHSICESNNIVFQQKSLEPYSSFFHVIWQTSAHICTDGLYRDVLYDF